MAELGVLIPILGILTGMLAVWTRHQRSMAELGARGGNAADAASSIRIDELEDRLRVLERIITDKGYDVATQIEALRDERKLDAHLGSAQARERI